MADTTYINGVIDGTDPSSKVYINGIKVSGATDGLSINGEVLAEYRDMVLAESTLLHYWPMDELTGTACEDVEGSEDATLSGALVGKTGKVGPGFYFDGTNDTWQTDSAIDLTSYNKIVMEAIVKYPSYPHDELSWEFGTTFSDAGSFYFGPELSGDSTTFLNGNVGMNYSTYNQPAAGAWHHIVVVYDMSIASGHETKLYVDSALQASTGGSTNNNTGTFGNWKLNVGCRNGASLFCNQYIQHLAMYSSLSEARITAHYARGFL